MKFTKVFLITILSILYFSSCSDKVVEPEPETQFVQIQFKYNFNDELNTFENYLKKDLIRDGSIKIRFWLTEDEQNRIIEMVQETNFYTIPDTLLNTSNMVITPDAIQYLRIKNDGIENTVVWNWIPDEYRTEHYNKLRKLAKFIIELIESKPEYKNLPPRNGGYD